MMISRTIQFLGSLLVAVLFFVCASTVEAQETARPNGAIKMPDGTVVLYTQNPNDVAPKIDGVVLSAKEYQLLLEQAEQLKKAREAKLIAPSICRVRGKIDAKNGKPIAKLTLEFAFRTTVPRTSVLLGGQKASPTSATGSDGKLPLLELTADGLAVLVEKPGEHTITLEFEAAVLPRSGKNELGFEIGLPRAAITTLVFEPPSGEVKKLTVGSRTAGSTETVRTSDDAARYAPKSEGNGVPLGPIDLLEIAWDAPAMATAKPTEATATETDISVQVDETQIETTVKWKLKGSPREWIAILPKDASATATAANGSRPETLFSATPTITRPSDSKQPLWRIQTPDASEWLITAVVRQARPDPKDAKHGGPYLIPIAMLAGLPRQSGSLRVFAPPSIRLSNFKASAEIRRQESVAGADAPVAVFKFTTADKKPPTLEFEARPARGFTAVQPHHKLALTREGWRLKTELRVTPVRSTLEQIAFELPTGWSDPIARPDERVDEVLSGKEVGGKRTIAIRLAASQSEPFTLTIETVFAVGANASEVSLPLPRFLQAIERDTQFLVSVPSEWTVRATALESVVNAVPEKLQAVGTAKPGSAVTELSGTFDTPVSRLDVAWQQFRAELIAHVRADLTIGERQLNIVETIQFQANDSLVRPIRLTGPMAPLAFQPNPAVEPAGNGVWLLPAARDAKEVVFQVSYSVPIPPRSPTGMPVPVDIPLVWPDATKVTANVRVWGTVSGNSRRPTNVQGAWEERAPEPSAERDSLPWLTLAASGSAKEIPLAFELIEQAEPGGILVERMVVQSVVGSEGTILGRGRFLLKRWPPSGIDLEIPSLGMPTVFVNRERVENLTPLASSDESYRVVRVPFPEMKQNRPAVVEVQYHGLPQSYSDLQLLPPRIRDAVLLAPARWHVGVPQPRLPLVFSRSFASDHRWGWRQGVPAPFAAYTPLELDRWFAGGGAAPENELWEATAESTIAGRQMALAPIRVFLLPRLVVVGAASSFVFLVGLGLSRLSAGAVGGVVSLVAMAFIAFGSILPQPTAQIVSSALPGFLAMLLLLSVATAWRWVARRRITHLSSFRRGAALPQTPASANGSAGNNRPSRNGTALHEPLKSPSTPFSSPPATS